MSMSHKQRKQFFRTLTDRERVDLQRKEFKDRQLLLRLTQLTQSAIRESDEIMAGTHHEQMLQLSIF